MAHLVSGTGWDDPVSRERVQQLQDAMSACTHEHNPKALYDLHLTLADAI